MPSDPHATELSAADTVGHGDPHATRVDPEYAATQPDAASDVVPADSSGAATTPFHAGGTDSAGFARTGPPPLSTPAAQRFRILRPFQKGGLGQVSLAEDQELGREVALKEILPKHADSPEARQRFLIEAEITGSLEHPGVVPVYGLGQYADGRPFYAMRFICGENLQLAIEEFHRPGAIVDRDLRFRQLLGRFVDVCNAIEYAHNRCVLHRDLKPGNIMLGKYGETLVVDWGLAKTLGPAGGSEDSVEHRVRPPSAGSSTETRLGRVVGTPAYMSPEQAAGRVDMLGPATDVYSLGATLYHLLVGRAPFVVNDGDALLGNVQIGRFDAPRTLNRDVAKPLNAICLMAMARRPEDRYPSARALADDVERYLADEPVVALPDTVLSRIARWMRRHRAAVLGAGGVLATISALLGVGVVLLNAANDRAERNFRMARDAIRDYYQTISEDELLEQPQLRPLRDELLERALNYYKQFLAAENRTDAATDELAQASFYAGQITETIESPAEAVAFYEQAANLNARLVAQAPADKTRLAEQARTLAALGGSLQKLSRYDDSTEALARAESVQRKLLEAEPENSAYVRSLADTVARRSEIAAAQGNAREALAQAKAAEELLSRLPGGGAATAMPGKTVPPADDAAATADAGAARIAELDAQVDELTARVAQPGATAADRRALGLALVARAEAARESGPTAASADATRAVEILQPLAAASPDDAEVAAAVEAARGMMLQ